jgi:hypothetical protein
MSVSRSILREVPSNYLPARRRALAAAVEAQRV